MEPTAFVFSARGRGEDRRQIAKEVWGGRAAGGRISTRMSRIAVLRCVTAPRRLAALIVKPVALESRARIVGEHRSPGAEYAHCAVRVVAFARAIAIAMVGGLAAVAAWTRRQRREFARYRPAARATLHIFMGLGRLSRIARRVVSGLRRTGCRFKCHRDFRLSCRRAATDAVNSIRIPGGMHGPTGNGQASSVQCSDKWLMLIKSAKTCRSERSQI